MNDSSRMHFRDVRNADGDRRTDVIQSTVVLLVNV